MDIFKLKINHYHPLINQIFKIMKILIIITCKTRYNNNNNTKKI